MKGHGEKKYSKAQVITMLTIAFLLVGSLSYAVVYVPYNFSANTTISSSQVNANFSALGNAMPAFRIYNPGGATITGTSGAYQVLGSYSFIAPANGYVKVKVSCSYAYCYRTNTTVTNSMYFGMSNSSSGFWNYAVSSVYYNSADTYTYFNPQSEWYGNVYAGNTYTYYVMAFRDTSGYNTWYISTPLMTMEFYPSLM